LENRDELGSKGAEDVDVDVGHLAVFDHHPLDKKKMK
jgi:hypothetical protein